MSILTNSEAQRLVLERFNRRPMMGMLLKFNSNYDGTSSTITVASTSITICHQGQAEAFTYPGKTLVEVASEINSTNLKLDAKPLASVGRLSSGDFLTGTYSFLPATCSAHVEDQIKEGIILRLLGYNVKTNRQTHFQLLAPYDDGPLMPWYPRITVGDFVTEVRGLSYRFTVPDYAKTPWSLRHGKPYVDIVNVSPTFVKTGVIKVPRFPIYWNGSNIVLYEGDRPLSIGMISDVDIYNGLIYLSSESSELRDLSVHYTYLEKTFQVRDININPHIDQQPALLDKVVLIYLQPSECPIPLRDPKIVNYIVGTSIEGAIANIPVDHPDIPICIIGALLVKQPYVVGRIDYEDTRSLGGGLFGPRVSPVHKVWEKLTDPEERKKAQRLEAQYEETQFLADIGHWDGQPAPAAGCVLIGLPEYLREALPISELRKRVEENLAAGIYPVLDFYNVSGRMF